MSSWKENPVSRYLLESYVELRKVIWPTRPQIVNHSLLVIGLSLALAAYFGIVDYVLNFGLEQVLTFTR